MSPCEKTAGHPSKGMADVGELELGDAFAGRPYDRLQLRVDLELLDHMAHVPLDGVRGDAEALRHRDRVKTLREQMQDVELAGRELGEELLALALLGDDSALSGDRTCKQLDRNQDLALGRAPDGFDDLVGGRV